MKNIIASSMYAVIQPIWNVEMASKNAATSAFLESKSNFPIKNVRIMESPPKKKARNREEKSVTSNTL